MLVSLLPPGISSEGDTVVDCLVRWVTIGARVCVDTAVGTTYNTVIATVGIDVVVGVVPWQRQGRQSIG